MKLPRAGKEFARWTVTTTDALTGFEVQIVAGTWAPATYAQGVVSLLVCGPDCTDKSGAVTVPVSCQPAVRCVDNPELVIRRGGWIILT